MSEDEKPEPQCGNCGRPGSADVPLFHVAGGWGWKDDEQDGRLGLCMTCGMGSERFTARFTEAFGNVVFIRDTDSGHSRDELDSGKPPY